MSAKLVLAFCGVLCSLALVSSHGLIIHNIKSNRSGNDMKENVLFVGEVSGTVNYSRVLDLDVIGSGSHEPEDTTTIPPAPTVTPLALTTTPSAPTAPPSAPTTTPSAPTTTPSVQTTTPSAPTTTPSAPTTTLPALTTTPSAPTTTFPAPTTTFPAPTTTSQAPTTTTPAPVYYKWVKLTSYDLPAGAVYTGDDVPASGGGAMYVGRALYNGFYYPTKVIPKIKGSYAVYELEKEMSVPVTTVEVIVPEPPYTLEWSRGVHGVVPKGVISTGTDIVKGKQAYIGRAAHYGQGGWTVSTGWVIPDEDKCYIPFYGAAIPKDSVSTYDYLVVGKI